MTQPLDHVDTETPPDARSTVRAFEDHLRKRFVLTYAKDMHFQHFGFDFVKSQSDIDQFLQELDDAPRCRMSNGCTKAWLIRNYLERHPADSTEEMVKNFKCVAARARRTNCGCHDTGSYARTQRPIYVY